MKLMRNMIAKETENKQRGFILEQNVVHNSPISDADVVPILGSIPEGTDSNERLGDRVKPKALVVRGVIAPNPAYNPDNKPLIVSVYILSCKDKKTNALVTAGAGMAYLLKPNIGGTEEVPFDGSTFRQTFPVNSDKFKVHFQKKYIISSGSVAGGNPRGIETIRWQYSFKSLPASLTWDAGTGDDCNNFAPFMVIGYSYADGSAGEGLQTRLVSQATAVLDYEDA